MIIRRCLAVLALVIAFHALSSPIGARAEDGIYAGLLVTLSQQGIDYARDVLVNSVLEELTPMSLPQVTKTVEWPIGIVDVVLSKVAIRYANISTSDIHIDNQTAGVSVYASGVQTELSLDWRYSYSARLIPFPISDSGSATAKVKDGMAWIQTTMQEHQGTLSVTVNECETNLASLNIELKGGQSWLYQLFVYAFQGQIQNAIESAITTQILGAVDRLNGFLLSLPRELPVDNTSAVDVTVVQDPILSSDYISVGVQGEFIDVNSDNHERYQPSKKLPAGLLCSGLKKMVTIALEDFVISSASDVYYKAGQLSRLIDKLPQQSILNTAKWKFLIPQLYRKYPNDDLMLNISASSAPVVAFTRDGIKATTAADMTIIVLDKEQTIPVACVGLEIILRAVAGIVGTSVTAQASLVDLRLSLKWSEIGTFPVRLVETATKTIVKDVVLPLVNLNLRKGLPLPVIPAIELEDASIRYEDSFLLICADIRYTGLPVFVGSVQTI